MAINYNIPDRLMFPGKLASLMMLAAAEMVVSALEPVRAAAASKTNRGLTLRPGKSTPLWNELRAQLRPHLAGYGDQANLGRIMGLPRQRINAFITEGSQMPDAERTLQLIAWLSTRPAQIPAKKKRPSRA
jgi:hypothetical protein